MATTIILIVLALMVIAMMTDLFDFGVAPMLAVIVLALTGVVTFEEAFGGFVNKYVIVTAAFLVISAVFSRTSLITWVQDSVINLQKGKSGTILYLVLILITLVIAALTQPGPAALLIVLILSAIPSGEGQTPKSQMLLPLGTLCNLGQIKFPIGVTLLLVVWANGFLETAGFAGQVELQQFVLMGILPLIVAIVYTLLAHRMLPKHEIATAVEEGKTEETEKMSRGHEIIVYLVFALSTIGLFFSLPDQLGDYIFLIPVAGVALMIVTGVLSFKETRGLVSHQIVFMLAGIFALADIMASKGITDMLGASIQNMLGTSSSGWVIMFVFAFATVLLANITGSNYGTLLIMAPIAASTAVVAGVDPRGIVLATMGSALASVLLPLDTAMGVIFANGKYNLVNTLKYTIPLTILYIGALCLSTGLLFPF